MNKWEKEALEAYEGGEAEVLKKIEKQYKRALADIDRNIMILQSDELTQSRIYRIEHQKALRQQVSAILDKLHSDEYATISQFLSGCYTDGFVGAMYNLHGQGIPLLLPIDPRQAVRAVLTDSKLSKPLYEALSVDFKKLKRQISAEISRGISSGMSYNEIARNISWTTNAPMSRARTIVRTEAHRITQASHYDAATQVKKKGVDIVLQWDASLDGDTRDTHRMLDGTIIEVGEYFESSGNKARYPGDFGDPAEDCNCRCVLTERARSALDEDELKTLQERAEFFGIDKTDNLNTFREKYLNLTGEWAVADTELSNFLGADSRDILTKIQKRGIIEMQQGFSCFPDGDVLAGRSKLVQPIDGFFDVAMHGSQTAVAFGSKEANMSPRLLASLIRHSKGYSGQNIRLLSCNTGKPNGDDLCFAEELANALGVVVEAPDNYLIILPSGKLQIGYLSEGRMRKYKPNERRRLK